MSPNANKPHAPLFFEQYSMVWHAQSCAMGVLEREAEENSHRAASAAPLTLKPGQRVLEAVVGEHEPHALRCAQGRATQRAHTKTRTACIRSGSGRARAPRPSRCSGTCDPTVPFGVRFLLEFHSSWGSNPFGIPLPFGVRRPIAAALECISSLASLAIQIQMRTSS